MPKCTLITTNSFNNIIVKRQWKNVRSLRNFKLHKSKKNGHCTNSWVINKIMLIEWSTNWSKLSFKIRNVMMRIHITRKLMSTVCPTEIKLCPCMNVYIIWKTKLNKALFKILLHPPTHTTLKSVSSARIWSEKKMFKYLIVYSYYIGYIVQRCLEKKSEVVDEWK